MFCTNCGQEIDDNADICIHCGVATAKSGSPLNSLDNPSHIPGVAGCCFPIVGIILYFVWKDKKPLSAKLVIKWTLTGLAINVIFTIIYVLIFIMANA